MNNSFSFLHYAVDLHVHIGPEIIPRKYRSVAELIKSQGTKLGGVALKNHFFPTAPMVPKTKNGTMRIVGSVVLNSFVGGINPDAVYAASTLADGPFIVWFPTVSAKQFLINSAWEIAPEWVDPKKPFIARRSTDVIPLAVTTSSGVLTDSVIHVLKAIQTTGAILATGHISWKESRTVIKKAAAMGIQKMIVTHPIYQKIAMPISVQKELAASGALMEQCWSMWRIDNIPIRAIADQIRSVGPEHCIITSDAGQSFSPPPRMALEEFCRALLREGISQKALKRMCIQNPKRLIAMI